MLRRYSFIPVFLCILVGLGWWANRMEPVRSATAAGIPPAAIDGTSLSARRELLETLERVVIYEHYYRSVYGHFTKLLSRVGYTIPHSLLEVYDVRVAEASTGRLLVTALSEIDGKVVDLVSINQDYEVRSNFSLPLPRPEYLRAKALRHLRLLRDAPKGHAIEEYGIFKEFYKYEVRNETSGSGVAFAVGTRAPVLGERVELDAREPANWNEANLFDSSIEDDLELGAAVTGEKSKKNVMSTLEEAYLAQRIFRGEVGRHAKSWSELKRIVAFRFEDQARYSSQEVPFGDSGPVTEIDAPEYSENIQSNQLIIEPISSSEFDKI